MAGKDGNIRVRVATDVEMEEVRALEDELNRLKKEKIQLNLQADKQALTSINNEIDKCKQEIQSLSSTPIEAKANSQQINDLVAKIEELQGKKVDLELKVADQELKNAESEVNEIDGKEINLQLATANIMAGLQVVKQGVSELAGNMGEVLSSAGRLEQTEAFLAMNIGADQAKQKMEEIRSVTDQLPGDDVTLQNLLSQAALKDAGMGVDAFKQMGSAAADYMAAMQNFGKTSTETQQDLMNYILAGNTAEIERSPILQAHVDKLKEGNTVQERSKLLQEALTAEGWKGVASLDIYNNKQQSFNDLLERGKTDLGNLFLKGSEGAMGYIMQLNDATDGLVGMGIAAANMAGGPLFNMVTGLGQIALAYNTLKEAKIIQTAVDWALAAAEWAAAGPMILIIALAAAIIGLLILLYMNSEQVRNAINGLGEAILNAVTGAFNSLDQALTNAINSFNEWGNNLVNSARNAVTGFMQYISSLPGRFLGELNKMLQYAKNFVLTLPSVLKNAAINMVKSWIFGSGERSPGYMYDAFTGELEAMQDAPVTYNANLSKNIRGMATDMVSNWNPSLGSLNANISGTGSNGPVRDVNIYIDSVDNRDRIQEIADAVTRVLRFENTTAGRTV